MKISGFEQLWSTIRQHTALLYKLVDGRQPIVYNASQDRFGGIKRMKKELVSYIRVSTKGQAASGLGLDAQRQAVADYARQIGAKIIREFKETESGKKTDVDRPQLAAALKHCESTGAVLVVAKLDRLARNVAFLSKLMEAGAEFIACDNPAATKFTIHILAAVAELEREMISKRTKEGLAQAKKRGVKLGSARKGHWKGKEHLRLQAVQRANKVAVESIKQKARKQYELVRPIIELRNQDSKTWTYQALADKLNSENHKTRQKKPYGPMQVRNLYLRFAAQ